MSENMGEFSREEIGRQIQDLAPEIERILEERMREEYQLLCVHVGLQGESPDAYWPYGSDVYSFPGCDCVLKLEPPEGFSVAVFMVVRGEDYIFPHHAFVNGQLIIDATFGQFVNLDSALSEAPDLFVGRIFVGSTQQADERFGVRYISVES